ncbi:MAG: heparinase II/III-family protein [Puniceicoccales bacterium]|jgi:hypothetical protein|nr:heparinase II/III-family protein [Puniceicoccales bacterium]
MPAAYIPRFLRLRLPRLAAAALTAALALAALVAPALARNTETPKAVAPAPGLLSAKFPDAASVRAVLTPRASWHPFPAPADRAAWAKADAVTLKACSDSAAAAIGYDWPSPPATLALLISRTGNRSEYQAVSYKKRIVLANMIIAEIAENKGRYIEPIINGVWSICEESWWGSTAHLPRRYKGLMDVTRPRVDLYAAVTGGILAWADYFFGKKFDAVSPQIRKRIRHEVRTRVLDPVMQHHHWWMSADPDTGERPNNWNPWICSNWLTCALLLEDDENRRAAHVARILQVLDAFLTPYPNDGGCDEGPGYWGAAVGAFYDNLALLNVASDGAFRFVFQNEKVKNMGRYIYLAQIGERYAVNFADAPPSARPEAYITHRYAKDIGDAPMRQFAAACRWPGHYADYVRSHFARDFFNMFHAAELRAETPALTFPRDVWFPDLQAAFARESAGSQRGFYFAAKGGTNNESHNHNDIGNVIVYYDGQPVLIDIGSGRYTARTFAEGRYNIWNHSSDYHNTAAINGVPQHFGGQYRATNATFTTAADKSVFSLDIARAYPTEAGVKRWTRTITLLRSAGKDAAGGGVLIRDETDLARAENVAVHFMTNLPAHVAAPGQIVLQGKDAAGKPAEFILEYDAARIAAEVEKVPLVTEEDTGVKASWGDNIRRVKLRVLRPLKQETYLWRVRKK